MSYSHEILPRTHPEFLLCIVLCCCKSLQKIIYVLLTKCIVRVLPTSSLHELFSNHSLTEEAHLTIGNKRVSRGSFSGTETSSTLTFLSVHSR